MKETTVFRIEQEITEQFVPAKFRTKYEVLIEPDCSFTDSEGNMNRADSVMFSCFSIHVTNAEYKAMIAPFVNQLDAPSVLRIDKGEGRIYLVRGALKTMFPNPDKVAKEKKPSVRLFRNSKVDAEHASYAYLHSVELLLRSATGLAEFAEETYPQSDYDSPARTEMHEIQDKLLALSIRIDKFINS